ncbi:MAG: DUF1674 domain-containing protein [Nevskia sp.]|nr:DUF1674 domain-containing protein [Nevskia sp.]
MHPTSPTTPAPEPPVRKHRPATNAAGDSSAAVPLAAILAAAPVPETVPGIVPEIGGRKDGTDPTRFGDWEKNGRCIDF